MSKSRRTLLGREKAIVDNGAGGRRFSRRHLFAIAAGGAAASLTFPAWARNRTEWTEGNFSWGQAKLRVERALSFRHRHTDETLDVVYYANGRYLQSALDQVNYLFRDFRNEQVIEIDPGLLDTLYAVRLRTETTSPFDILSAYRSPETNAMLRRSSWRVARNSLHMKGMAVDIRLGDRDARYIARAARDMGRGGVGFYSRSNFVHLDTGTVRTWGG
ncbi:MAG: DUF882 domain-containing protein [Rhodospirillales bacterium]|nr:DUF882 domain-containing protein [Rhodospirillales bacterium]